LENRTFFSLIFALFGSAIALFVALLKRAIVWTIAQSTKSDRSFALLKRAKLSDCQMSNRPTLSKQGWEFAFFEIEQSLF